jgi:hypothetical protein
MFTIDLITLLVFILAVFRITHLFIYDRITLFIRKPFVEEIYLENESGEGHYEVIYKGNSFSQAIGYLLSCPWCLGIWVSIGVVITYWLWPTIVWPILIVFAIAGGAVLLETYVDGK